MSTYPPPPAASTSDGSSLQHKGQRRRAPQLSSDAWMLSSRRGSKRRSPGVAPQPAPPRSPNRLRAGRALCAVRPRRIPVHRVLHLPQDHALADQALEGLRRAHRANVVQNLQGWRRVVVRRAGSGSGSGGQVQAGQVPSMLVRCVLLRRAQPALPARSPAAGLLCSAACLVPEACVEEVQHSMLSTAHIQVHWHPVLLSLLPHQPEGRAQAESAAQERGGTAGEACGTWGRLGEAKAAKLTGAHSKCAAAGKRCC